MKVSQEFFNRPADVVARELIAMELCVRNPEGSVERLIITETEAYMGPHDLASHASKGRTARTEVMFGPPGSIYVCLIYGMYHMLNIVTGEEGYPAAVLIRGAGVYDGPGKLTRALAIDGRYNARSLSKESGIWVESPRTKSTPVIIETPRIGVAYAKEWALKELRFVKGE